MRVRFYSHLQQQTGYGRAALELAQAMDLARIDLELQTIGPRDSDFDLGELSRSLHPIGDPDAIIVHTLPGDCHRVLELEGLRRGAGPKLVAYTTWEALTAPEDIVRPLFDCFDQVWAPSQPAAQALAENGLHGSGRDRESAVARVRIIPHCYDDSVERPQREDAVSTRFRFYWIGAWTARKNPQGLIRAFALAFGPGSNVELVMHSPDCSMDTFVAALAATGLGQHELPMITLSHHRLTEKSLAKLHFDADCFVTAARGEAWNLPAFDAMLYGRHVISQYGLGSDEFLVDTSADLIDGLESPAQVDLTQAYSDDGSITFKRKGAQGMTSRSLWLEPNLSSLAEAMRSAFHSRKSSITINYNVAERFGYAAIGKQVLNVLEEP
jgi:glycosyltransferase involved in cell wall biosynthesis